MPSSRKLAFGAVGAAAVAAGIARERRNPSACPYSQRWMIDIPHPGISRKGLREALQPKAGERLLEIGPGTGYYSLGVAEQLRPSGRLDVFDLQQEMLDHTLKAAGQRGIDNIDPTRGDARELPYPDDSFDGAFLVTTLGEIPDQSAALRELHRVLRAEARVVVGEMAIDPHFVSPRALRSRAEAAGFRFEQRLGSPLAYFGRLVAA